MAKAKARSDGSVASRAWGNGDDAGYKITYISICIWVQRRATEARSESEARQTYGSLLGRAVELARELLVEELLAGNDVEEVRKGVESVVKSGA